MGAAAGFASSEQFQNWQGGKGFKSDAEVAKAADEANFESTYRNTRRSSSELTAAEARLKTDNELTRYAQAPQAAATRLADAGSANYKNSPERLESYRRYRNTLTVNKESEPYMRPLVKIGQIALPGPGKTMRAKIVINFVIEYLSHPDDLNIGADVIEGDIYKDEY